MKLAQNITSWKELCAIFIYSFKRIRNLTRFAYSIPAQSGAVQVNVAFSLVPQASSPDAAALACKPFDQAALAKKNNKTSILFS